MNHLLDPLATCLALGPLAAYLLLLGFLNLGRRSLVTTGGRDTAALAVAVAGLVIVGPAERLIDSLLPVQTIVIFGWFLWILLIAFYCLTVTLLILMQRPRLVVYNSTADVLRPILAEVAASLDPDVRWAGNSLVLPRLHIELHMESFPPLRHVSLVGSHDEQNIEGWQRLEQSLSAALVRIDVPRNPSGVALVSASLAIVALIYWRLAGDPQGVAQAFFEMLRL